MIKAAEAAEEEEEVDQMDDAEAGSGTRFVLKDGLQK